MRVEALKKAQVRACARNNIYKEYTMKTLNTQTVAKPGFTKSKAFGLCGTLALATALLIGAGQVSADETTQPVADTQPAVSNVYTADNAGNITVTPSETVGETPKVLAPAPVESQPIAETPATTTEAAQPVAETPAAPTSVVKDGDTITVENPNVEVTFPNGTGKYSPFEVEYKDVEFPDSMAINEGDKVVTELPKEIGLQTSFDFDVYNNENVVGKANADAQTRKITTTFNNYFTSHPLNKKMSLKFDAKWLDVVEPGKPVTVNFNGTVKTFTIGEEGPLPSNELLSKWGSQNKQDPRVINWTLRLNTARQVLNNAVLSDTWSDNQEFIEGSQNIYFVEDPIKWTGIDHAAKDFLESWNVRADGFDAKFKEFNKIMYIDYQTRLKSAVKDSTNPTNKAVLTADDSNSKSSSKVQLVGGRGDASGENKPEEPKEEPKPEPQPEPKPEPKPEPEKCEPKVIEKIVEKPVEVIKEVEKPVYIEKEVIKEVPKEVIKEAPVIKEVIKEVPVEKVVTVVKEVPVEKIKEIVKEVPVEKVKEIIKEVPVEVIKEVPVEKIVEVVKVKEVIKEVPVEKIVTVVKEVPVEKVVTVIKEVCKCDKPSTPAEPNTDKPSTEKPVTPTPNKPQKPSTPEKAPKTSVDNKAAQSVAVSYNLEPVNEAPKTAVYGGVLPNTGEKEGIASTLGLVVIAAGITGLTLGFKKRNEK